MIQHRSTLKPLHKAALRAVAVVMLSGCYSTSSQYADYPQDYRKRHPITLKEGTKTVEVFLGRSRGGLSPNQRADVLSFAQNWKHEANSGILIDVPNVAATRLAAADSIREIRSILNASGVPANGVRVRSYAPADVTLPSIRLNYARLSAHAGPCGQWNDLGPTTDPAYIENWPHWNLGCATQRNLASMVANPTSCSRVAKRPPIGRAARSRWTNTARAKVRPAHTTVTTQARSAISANDKARTASRGFAARRDNGASAGA